MKRYFLILSILVTVTLLAFGQKTDSNALPFGVNLASAEFGHGSPIPGEIDVHYFYPTVEDLEYWKSKGLTLIRIPFKWERIQHELNGSLNKDEVSKIKYLLNEASRLDMKIILDLHNYGRRKVANKARIIGEDSLSIENFTNFWGQMAKEFNGHKAIYGYGLMNEPHDMLQTTPWEKIAQACIFEIRKYDNKTTVIVGGNYWSSANRWLEESNYLKNLYDPSNNTIFEAHVYFDEDGSGVYRRGYDEEKAHPFIGIERTQPFVKWLKENKLKGFIGEYGVPADDQRWLVCLDNLLSYLQQQGVNGTYWAAGAKWNKYILSVQPSNNYSSDKPQVNVLTKYKTTK
ncbi:MAG: glycoside hydrolase family 5 protein [Paludibacter sp.]